jgi:hypothetical protein
MHSDFETDRLAHICPTAKRTTSMWPFSSTKVGPGADCGVRIATKKTAQSPKRKDLEQHNVAKQLP